MGGVRGGEGPTQWGQMSGCPPRGRGGGDQGCPCSHEVGTRVECPGSVGASSPSTQTPAEREGGLW